MQLQPTPGIRAAIDVTCFLLKNGDLGHDNNGNASVNRCTRTRHSDLHLLKPQLQPRAS